MGTSKLDDDPEVVEQPLDAEAEDDDDGGDDVSTKDNDSSSESEEEEDDDEDVHRKTKKRFDKILSDLRASAKADEVKYASLDLTDRQDLQTFMNQNAPYIANKDPKDMNLLHWIAEAEKEELPSARRMKSLITALVRLPENLLADRDDNGKTPLLCAITNRHHRLAKIMCDAHSDANSILKIPKSRSGKQSSNCLHQAIVKKASSKDDDLIKFLIEKADTDTICARDENGLTPLHLAVEYKRCDEAQFQVVQTLVERCDAALDETYKHPEKGHLSPYRYLELTHAEAKQKEKTSARKERTESEAATKSHTTRDYLREKKVDQIRDKSRDRVSADKQQALKMTPTHVAAPVGKFASRLPPDRVRGPLGLNTSLEVRKADDVLTPVEQDKRREKEKKVSSRRSKSSRLMPTDASAEAIKQYLKLRYLRERDHDAAVEFLYGVQQDKQIYFDLVGIDPKVSKGRITSGLTHLVFEDVLQYVAIPRVEVEEDLVRLKPGQRAPKPDGKGRTDMKPLFAWLRDTKKVKTILRVIVDDLQEPAHSDEAIESCLTGFGVEIWDWKKRDLSPEVIQAVAPNARIVHLYWGGNNAILRAWSESEGLKKLLKLETIHLHVQQGLESRTRIKNNVAEFKKRMEPIEIRETKLQGDMTDSAASGADAAREPFERHKWMTSMEEFSDFLQTAERNADREPPLSLRYPVTVAIIDDGVDINEPTIQSKIIGGRSFCRRDPEQNLNQPYYVSGGGHGTAMAGFIGKMCPNVKLVILRLDEFFIEPGKRQITAKSAAKAVRTAIEKKVDIICMAWTIEQTDSNRDDIKALSSAISDAAAENILMFCAATDQGAFKDHTYPAAAPTSNIFKIGAAEASGNAMKWLGDQTRVDFIFPGHQVVIERHDDPSVKKYTALTGSSVATALASGLAAVILYCVQLAGMWRDAGRPDELRAYRSLKNHERMKEAFSQIGTTKESENKYIMVWNRFGRVVKKAENELQAKDMWIDKVAQLADDLMREA